MKNSWARETPRPALSNTVATNYMWLFKFQLNLIEVKLKKKQLTSHISSFPELHVATILDSTDMQCFYCHRKC